MLSHNIDGNASSDITHARLPVEISPIKATKWEILKLICAATKHRPAEKFGTKDQKTAENIP